MKGAGRLPCCPASISHLVPRINCSALSGWRDFPSLLSVLVTRLSGACNNGFLFRTRNQALQWPSPKRRERRECDLFAERLQGECNNSNSISLR